MNRIQQIIFRKLNAKLDAYRAYRHIMRQYETKYHNSPRFFDKVTPYISIETLWDSQDFKSCTPDDVETAVMELVQKDVIINSVHGFKAK